MEIATLLSFLNVREVAQTDLRMREKTEVRTKGEWGSYSENQYFRTCIEITFMNLLNLDTSKLSSRSFTVEYTSLPKVKYICYD